LSSPLLIFLPVSVVFVRVLNPLAANAFLHRSGIVFHRKHIAPIFRILIRLWEISPKSIRPWFPNTTYSSPVSPASHFHWQACPRKIHLVALMALSATHRGLFFLMWNALLQPNALKLFFLRM